MNLSVLISDPEAQWSALRSACRGHRDATSFQCSSGALDRFRRALFDTGLTLEERLIRVRHALRHAATSTDFGQMDRSLPLQDRDAQVAETVLQRFGLMRRASGEVTALPWMPDWLPEVPSLGADHAAMAAMPRPWNHQAPPADPWVRTHMGIDHYRGPGQACAVRSALHMPPGQTLVVVLPTGEGKSMVFQALAAANPGNTVAVVVPTVTLAQDQELALHQRGADMSRYYAYVGGDMNRTSAITTALRDGTQGLLFAAPEAYASSLREPLLQAAREGRLAGLVVDEAHLVEAWGTDFRSDFQWLGALVAELRAIAPTDARPRVICLSATLSQIAFDTLEALFSPSEPLSLMAAPRLRPEQDLWVARSAESTHLRAQRVIEALRHLPRPAVLYVTVREDAEWWKAELQKHGFRRIGVVHGDTDAASREQVVKQWRAGDLELVVGTSAFGLGIDAAQVRTVIHACLPETLDRYYQEIGRTGRDNRAAAAVLIPALQDLHVAEQLSRKTVIGEEKGRQRWEALFLNSTRLNVVGHRILVDVSASPSYEPDMRSGRNEDWNINVLNLLVRAGVIRYAGIERRRGDDKVLLAVDICDQRHLEPDLWRERIGPLRSRMAQADRIAHESVRKLLKSDTCPRSLFQAMYRLHYQALEYDVTPACGGCPVCRRTSPGWFAQWPQAPRAPFQVGRLGAAARKQLDSLGRLFVAYRREDLPARRFQRHLRQFVEALWRVGIRKFFVVGNCPEALREALQLQPWCVAEGDRTTTISSSGLPPGPCAVWMDSSTSLPVSQLDPGRDGAERLLIIPQDSEDPRYPGDALATRVHLVPLEQVLESLSL